MRYEAELMRQREEMLREQAAEEAEAIKQKMSKESSEKDEVNEQATKTDGEAKMIASQIEEQ